MHFRAKQCCRLVYSIHRFDAYKKAQDEIWNERRAREAAEAEKWEAQTKLHAVERELEQPNPRTEEQGLIEAVISYCNGIFK